MLSKKEEGSCLVRNPCTMFQLTQKILNLILEMWVQILRFTLLSKNKTTQVNEKCHSESIENWRQRSDHYFQLLSLYPFRPSCYWYWQLLFKINKALYVHFRVGNWHRQQHIEHNWKYRCRGRGERNIWEGWKEFDKKDWRYKKLYIITTKQLLEIQCGV